MRKPDQNEYIKNDYCLYCSYRDCDCSTHEDPRQYDNCMKCYFRKCKDNPPNCYGVVKK